MGVLYARAFTSQALLDAWAEVRDAALADGQPDSEVDAFEANAARNLDELGTVLAAGEWQASPVRRVDLPKPSGGVRVLGVPRLVDRIVERALLRVLDPVIDPLLLPWSFAYRRGLGARDALAALAEARDSGMTWVARSDIRDCFPSIPQWEVLRRLREVVDDERIIHLVGVLLDRPVAGGRTDPKNRGLGLHQGSALSPLLSNLYLNAFDRAMLRAGFRVIRYSDDFAIPTTGRVAAEQALVSASTELEDLRLEINSGKSHVVSFDEGVRFLGEVTTASTINSGETLSHPMETVVYVDRQGSLVRSRGDKLVVTDGEESLLRLNLRRVRQVVCYGRVGLTTAFLHQAAERGIEVVLLTEQGVLGARLTAPTASDPQIRRVQYKAADDEQRGRTLAAAFVEGKVGNLRVAVLRSARREDDAEAFVAAELMRELAGRLPECATLDEILGIEGAASREYFQTLRRMLDPIWGFEGRNRRPPPDPVNAMLSYGYTILTHEAIAAAEAAGLDPMVGFLHQHRWGRPALALDLMEEFRPITVDVAMWRAISSGQIRPEQFENDPNQGCRMAADARHAFVTAYEKRMLTLTTHQPSGRRVSYRVALSLQAKALARALRDPGEPYVPLRWK
ncbi:MULTISPECIES: CRISPR-associated endonuclease Cas1 [Protofrankia]|uniref:CRISPR-associated endonuclease Cas1 n=1 Tax=Protofrankia TaxID=2994361 RepID=UPI00069A1AEB|nr:MULTISPECIES: CRISPR-associated endonuclease Cas1 [Protofrankia]